MKELCHWPLNSDNVKYNICTKGLAIWNPLAIVDVASAM